MALATSQMSKPARSSRLQRAPRGGRASRGWPSRPPCAASLLARRGRSRAGPGAMNRRLGTRVRAGAGRTGGPSVGGRPRPRARERPRVQQEWHRCWKRWVSGTLRAASCKMCRVQARPHRGRHGRKRPAVPRHRRMPTPLLTARAGSPPVEPRPSMLSPDVAVAMPSFTELETSQSPVTRLSYSRARARNWSSLLQRRWPRRQRLQSPASLKANAART
mmetsp:Transcript_110647/g.308257  ORF Transcript_110647/g.308257 Transcript_110647/m.308257 type:complete len:219 (-) Transcript_110647:957-1613(-)